MMRDATHDAAADGCPDPSVLIAFVKDSQRLARGKETIAELAHARLPAPWSTRERLREHIDECEACLAAVMALVDQVPDDPEEEAPDQPDQAGATGERHGEDVHQLGPYELEAKLGAGGMGIVYRAFEPRLARHVAIKLMRQISDADDRRLLSEAQALAKIEHPNVVKVYDVIRAQGSVAIVMELVSGATMREWHKAQPPLAVVGVLAQAATGLAAIHRAGMVHRDVKPDNILLELAAGEVRRVLVSDLGLAKADSSAAAGRFAGSSASRHTTIAAGGTPAYMAPEQLDGGRADAHSDVFALAVTACEMLTGRRPFSDVGVVGLHATANAAVNTRPELDQLPKEVSSLAPILRRALAQDPSQRPAMVELRDALAKVGASHAKQRAPARSIRAVWMGIVAATLIAVAGGVWVAVSGSDGLGAPLDASNATTQATQSCEVAGTATGWSRRFEYTLRLAREDVPVYVIYWFNFAFFDIVEARAEIKATLCRPGVSSTLIARARRCVDRRQRDLELLEAQLLERGYPRIDMTGLTAWMESTELCFPPAVEATGHWERTEPSWMEAQDLRLRAGVAWFAGAEAAAAAATAQALALVDEPLRRELALRMAYDRLAARQLVTATELAEIERLSGQAEAMGLDDVVARINLQIVSWLETGAHSLETRDRYLQRVDTAIARLGNPAQLRTDWLIAKIKLLSDRGVSSVDMAAVEAEYERRTSQSVAAFRVLNQTSLSLMRLYSICDTQPTGGCVAAYRQLIANTAKIYGSDHPMLAQLYANLSVILYQSDQMADALVSIDTAIAIAKRTYSARSLPSLDFLVRRGVYLSNLGRIEEANAQLEQARQDIEAIGGRAVDSYVLATGGLMSNYLEQERYADVIALGGDVAYDLHAEGTQSADVVRLIRTALAQAYAAQGNVRTAAAIIRELYQRAPDGSAKEIFVRAEVVFAMANLAQRLPSLQPEVVAMLRETKRELATVKQGELQLAWVNLYLAEFLWRSRRAEARAAWRELNGVRGVRQVEPGWEELAEEAALVAKRLRLPVPGP